MTAEQVEQWKRERDIAYQSKDEATIKAVEQHRVEMLMDCQMKTATRVKDLIKQQTSIVDSIKLINESLKERDSKLEELAKKSEEMDNKILDRFEKFEATIKSVEKSVDNTDLKFKLKEAQISGGLKAANWFGYLIYGLITTGLGGALMKLWQIAQQTQIAN